MGEVGEGGGGSQSVLMGLNQPALMDLSQYLMGTRAPLPARMVGNPRPVLTAVLPLVDEEVMEDVPRKRKSAVTAPPPLLTGTDQPHRVMMVASLSAHRTTADYSTRVCAIRN